MGFPEMWSSLACMSIEQVCIFVSFRLEEAAVTWAFQVTYIVVSHW